MKFLRWGIQALIFLPLICTASNTSALIESPCADKRDPQPIAIHLSLEYIIAACAPTPTNTTILSAGQAGDPSRALAGYSRVVSSLHVENYKGRRQAERRQQWWWWVSSLLGEYASMRPVYGGFMGLRDTLERILGRPGFVRWQLVWGDVCDRAGSVLSVFRRVTGLRTTASESWSGSGMTQAEIKEGFTQGFQVTRNVSISTSSANITSALIATPAFFSDEIKRLVFEAAEETGIMVTYVGSPQELIMGYEDKILDEEIPTSDVEFIYGRGQKNILALDYGREHFDIQTTSTSRCPCMLNSAHHVVAMGCHRILLKITEMLIARGGVLQAQIERGASYHDLFVAVHVARRKMAMQRSETGGEDQGQDQYHEWPPEWPPEWPLELGNWWVEIAEEENPMVLLRWKDVEAVEDAYVYELGSVLDSALMCLQSAQSKENQNQNDSAQLQTSPIDTVIIFGNYCDRALVHRAVRQSVGDHVKIIGAGSVQDVSLAARAGARAARKTHEMSEKARESMEADERRSYSKMQGQEEQDASRARHNEL